ncbi:MAG TPA: AMP-binding protein, partial [Quisquiliibacterium sp.]|nr:AMP-binding protein [Quisquiliibacterium sp.]
MHPYVHAQKTPDKIAYLMAGSGASVTYRQLEDASNRVAHLLRARGLKAGDHIAILLENHVRFFEICWGAQRAGIIYTAISSRLTAGEAAYIVTDCGAKLLVTSKALAGVAAEILPQIGHVASRLMIDGTIDGYEALETAAAAQPARRIADETAGATCS